MTKDTFFKAMCCFIAIRGVVNEIRRDQESNFIGAKNELQEALKQVISSHITTFLGEKL